METKRPLKTIISLSMLNEFNAEGCPSCGHKFTLGEPVVLACGAWDGDMKYIHENEAVFNAATNSYNEKRWYRSCQEGSLK
jgi:hypothetical protein